MYGYENGHREEEGVLSTTASRQERFQQLMTRWEALDWLESRIRIPRCSSYELEGGIYALSDTETLTCVELPSRARQTPARTWRHVNFEFPVSDFTFDPIQDLLVILEL
jgi:hypothetical protein